MFAHLQLYLVYLVIKLRVLYFVGNADVMLQIKTGPYRYLFAVYVTLIEQSNANNIKTFCLHLKVMGYIYILLWYSCCVRNFVYSCEGPPQEKSIPYSYIASCELQQTALISVE